MLGPRIAECVAQLAVLHATASGQGLDYVADAVLSGFAFGATVAWLQFDEVMRVRLGDRDFLGRGAACAAGWHDTHASHAQITRRRHGGLHDESLA